MSDLEPGLTITYADPRDMITLRGDFTGAAFGKAVKDVTGAALPDERCVTTGDAGAVIWMSPDEFLLLLEPGKASVAANKLQTALSGTHHLVADVTDARVTFALTGPGVREVLAKGAPVDLSPDAFTQGMVRRTRLGQIAAAFWMTGEDAFELVASRSVADFAETWLMTAARAGSLPGHFPDPQAAGSP
ncbi:sarcosine oxidase subunit gamma [Halovulum sp. GXIMD14793]